MEADQELKKRLREQLKKKLQNKINEKKLKNLQISEKAEKKIQKEIKNEKKLIETDKRVNPIMRRLYIEAATSNPNITDVSNPVYILDNLDETKLKFYKFLATYIEQIKKDIKIWKDDMILRGSNIKLAGEKEEYLNSLDQEYKKKFKLYFMTDYIKYMSYMTDINVNEDLMNI
jgi:hypothetical protein